MIPPPLATAKIQITRAQHLKAKPANQILGFGKYFTDHMLTIRYQHGHWQCPEIAPYQALPLDPAAAVLHYGQALFEGMKAFRQENGKIVLFRPQYNWLRMNQGAERLCMPSLPFNLFKESIKALIEIDKAWVPDAPHCSLYIRPTLIGTEPFLGVRPSEEYLFFVILSPVGAYYGQAQQQGVKIWIEEEFVRAAPGGLGATKAAANYANSLYAAHSAKQRGFAQVLWLDVNHQNVEEVGTMNAFFVFEKNGKITVVTPPLAGTILAGGLRECVLELLHKWNISVEIRPLALSEVRSESQEGHLKEVFGSGTAAVITAVEELHTATDSPLVLPQKGMGPIAQKLFNEITDVQYGRSPDLNHWLEEI